MADRCPTNARSSSLQLPIAAGIRRTRPRKQGRRRVIAFIGEEEGLKGFTSMDRHCHSLPHDDGAIMTGFTSGLVCAEGAIHARRKSATWIRHRRKDGVARSNVGMLHLIVMAIFLLALAIPRAGAAFVKFDNCLDQTVINGQANKPKLLQFDPLFFDAKFNRTDPAHHLNITIYGNVTGQSVEGTYPSPNDTQWNDPSELFGKIPNVSATNPNQVYTTLYWKAMLLTYTPYQADPAQFCLSTVDQACPLAPAFFANASNPYTLPGFTVAHDFYSSYAFSTLAVTVTVQSGDEDKRILGCISGNVTPSIEGGLSTVLTWIPAVILVFLGAATIFAAMFSPWGTTEIFRWSSNYGRDDDILRLVTPGFGDCLQYLQFIVLSGSLSLNFPGFYQPVISHAGWSALMFNTSFVSGGNGSNVVEDGMYNVNGTYGLSNVRALVGMAEDEDVWAGMAITLLVITIGVIALCQVGFALRWLYRILSNTPEEDLRSKNWPFTMGNVIRVVFNFFMLPIIALSMFQLVIAGSSTTVVVVMAVVLLVIVVAGACWIIRVVYTTEPRELLFDDLLKVLLYGPLYNTFADNAAPFVLIPLLITLMRGIAIGAVQPSGIAQVVLLAICEVIFILTLHAFHPYPSPTSMNAYHTFFSVVRLATILLSVAFVPTLGVTEGPRGWIGYAILLLHGIVLVFGFFLNAVQTVIEVGARMAGAGRDSRGGLHKVFGARQLSKRHRRGQRSSLNSDAVMLAPDADAKSIQMLGGRSRSLSASSAVLLNQHMPPGTRTSDGFDQFSQGYEGTSPGPGTPGGISATSPYSYLPSEGGGRTTRTGTMGTMGSMDGKIVGAVAGDPYYRPPRTRKNTLDGATSLEQARTSWTAAGEMKQPYQDSPEQDAGEGPSAFSHNRASVVSGAGISPAYLRTHGDESDQNLENHNTDYTVRESDFYYGVTRGPALSSTPSRKLKTGPADPTGPLSSTTGWFRGLFGGKSKEKGKGFEVVRSQRAFPPMAPLAEDELSPPQQHEPYHDSPEPYGHGSPEPAQNPTASRSFEDEDVETGDTGYARAVRALEPEPWPIHSDGEGDGDLISEDGDPFDFRMERVSDIPPMLGPIETGAGIELPSRMHSQRSRQTQPPSRTSTVNTDATARRPPTIPRRSSRRTPSQDQRELEQFGRMSTIAASPPHSRNASRSMTPEPNLSGVAQSHYQYLQPSVGGIDSRMPFGGEPSPSPERSPVGGNSAGSSIFRQGELQGDAVGDVSHHRAPSPIPSQQMAPQEAPDRPVNTGYVHHHTTSDSIRQGFNDPSLHMASSAEVVGDEDGRLRTR